MLMIHTTWYNLIWVLITSFTGMIAVGAAAGIMLIIPEGITDI
jgi:hypothetical protein